MSECQCSIKGWGKIFLWMVELWDGVNTLKLNAWLLGKRTITSPPH